MNTINYELFNILFIFFFKKGKQLAVGAERGLDDQLRAASQGGHHGQAGGPHRPQPSTPYVSALRGSGLSRVV